MASVKEMIESNNVLVLSKSYCPYCTAAKSTLNKLGVKGLKVVELDTIGSGGQLQAEAASLTGQRTVPNIWIGGKHVGGNSDLQGLGNSELQAMLKAASAL